MNIKAIAVLAVTSLIPLAAAGSGRAELDHGWMPKRVEEVGDK